MSDPLPGDEAEVDVGDLGAEEVLFALEDVIEDGPDAINLLEVALLGRGDVLGVELVEPDALAVVGALAGHLEVQVLLEVPFVGGGAGDAELVVLVVRLDEVLGDGAGLPEDEVAVVGVRDGGEAPVGVDLEEVGGLGVLDVVEGEGDVELVEDDGELLGVGTLGCEEVSVGRSAVGGGNCKE